MLLTIAAPVDEELVPGTVLLEELLTVTTEEEEEPVFTVLDTELAERTELVTVVVLEELFPALALLVGTTEVPAEALLTELFTATLELPA